MMGKQSLVITVLSASIDNQGPITAVMVVIQEDALYLPERFSFIATARTASRLITMIKYKTRRSPRSTIATKMEVADNNEIRAIWIQNNINAFFDSSSDIFELSKFSTTVFLQSILDIVKGFTIKRPAVLHYYTEKDAEGKVA